MSLENEEAPRSGEQRGRGALTKYMKAGTSSSPPDFRLARRQPQRLADPAQVDKLPPHSIEAVQLLDGSREAVTSRGGFGLFESAKDGKDEWLTPPEIVKALGDFDLDPSCPVKRPWPTAARHYTVHDNGLIKPWAGRVWMNPPYGKNCIRFMRRLADHGNGIALVCARTETAMFFETVWNKADAIFFFQGRLTFYHANGKRSTNCIGAPSCLVAYGAENVRAIRQSNLKGKLIALERGEALHSNT